MAQESCDLNKDEAEILKPSSSAPSPASPTSAAPPPPPQTAQIPEPPPPQSQPPPPPVAVSAAPQLLSEPCADIPVEASRKRKLVDATASDADSVIVAAEPLSPVLFVNRCNVCRKRVGLTGFRCRCGELFCPRHRHSETHSCTFDYKTAGREEIARANPVIRAAKIIKI